jgi:hypothetical protein
MKTSTLLLALALSTLPACYAAGKSRAGERLEYQERVTFTCEDPVDYRALQVNNFGPGPVQAEIELHDGGQHTGTILAGSRVNYVLLWVKRVTIVHADPAPATLEWSAAEALRDDIEVSVD